ncbi:MAG: chromosome segregation protein SMC [Actinomycetes bacterium]|jgi:chromosome segregation protein|nr:chromosome segregation protein SMC [Actinomycetes bacterium]
MYLKSLTLKGFKSFADRSVVHIEPGVTCVVGPNGSGKSNISDAVLWVLGEQSAKSLRGSAMEDVIFAGSSARDAVGVAEVDLVLDNADGVLPLEFNEVTITRRMYRSGESEYLINQSPTRLLDILDLLHDSGLGRDAHSIISQGRLAEVLEAKPETRRALIEEAAGVLKHKKRKERALRKLKNLDAHLERASDIAREIDRQLRPLERQATRAITHAELSAELREVEVALSVAELRRLQQDFEALGKAEREHQAALELARYDLGERERELDKLRNLLEEKGLFVGDVAEQRRRMTSVLERLDAGLLLLEEKGKNLIERLSGLRQTLHVAEKSITEARVRKDALTRERLENDAQLEELYTQLSDLRREAESARKARIAADDAVARVATDIRACQAQLNEASEARARLERSTSSLTIQRDLLQERARTLADEGEALGETLSARRVRFENLEEEWRVVKRDQALADADVDKRVRVATARKRDRDVAAQKLTDARARLKALEEVNRSYEAASPALAKLLAHSDHLEGFVGPVADHITATDELDTLVETLLGSDLYGVFVEDWSAAMGIARELRAMADGDTQAMGEVSLIPLARPEYGERGIPTTRGRTPDVGSRLLDELTCAEPFQTAAEALLGDVYLVDSVQSAIAAQAEWPQYRFATRDGVVIHPAGKLSFGLQRADHEGILARKRHQNELAAEIPGMDEDVVQAEADLSAAEDALRHAQADALEINQKSAEIAGQHDSLLAELTRLEEQLAKLKREEAENAARLESIDTELAAFGPQIEQLDAAREAAEAALAEHNEAQGAGAVERDTLFRAETRVAEQLNGCQVEIAKVSALGGHLKTDLSRATAEVAQLEETIATSARLEAAQELLRERLEPLHADFTVLRDAAEQWNIMLRDRAKLEQADSAELRQTVGAAQDKVRAAQAHADALNEALNESRVEKGQMEIQVNQAVRRVVEEHGTPLEVALTMPDIEDLHATEDRAFALRKKLANLGAVNPVAKEEFDALKARSDFMHEQMDDLNGARKALGKVVAAIDRKMKERFLATFDAVDKHFQDVFALLFPGGSAQLYLTEPDEPETSGVDFVVQPRGKRLKKMSLLSGGEQSLSALALLFALNRTRPCPFYILDEVEAALDDSNLRRFIGFIETMRRETQFLIVTHQRRTMEMADVLYGVSMQADGVSKLVSQKLEDFRDVELA